jgi:hypothetical protein
MVPHQLQRSPLESLAASSFLLSFLFQFMLLTWSCPRHSVRASLRLSYFWIA